MKKKQLEKRLKFLQALSALCKKDKFKYVDDCPDAMIDVICEACFNLLKLHSLKDDRRTKKKVKTINKFIEELCSCETSVVARRNLLKKEEIGKEVFSLLSNVVLPELEKLTAK